MSVRFRVEWRASLNGDCELSVEKDDGDTLGDLKNRAEEQASELIEDSLSTNDTDITIENIEVNIAEAEKIVCEECKGRKYLISILEGGAGLIKVSPCPKCQRIPNTVEVCKHILEVLEKADPEEGEEE